MIAGFKMRASDVKKSKIKREGGGGGRNKCVHCAGHLFLVWLMGGCVEWQRGDFSIRLMRGELKSTARGLQRHYRRKRV